MGKVFETTCPICGKEFKTKGSGAAGGLALHMYKKHGMTKEQWEQEEQLNDDVNWRFLDPNDPQERKAIDGGFTEITCKPGLPKTEQDMR